jgi:hypothetical protein
VEQEAAQELDRVQRHEFGAGAMGVIFPLETNVTVFERAQAVVGNGNAVRVASQILEYTTRSAKGGFAVDHPIDAGGLIAQSLEGSGVSEWF